GPAGVGAIWSISSPLRMARSLGETAANGNSRHNGDVARFGWVLCRRGQAVAAHEGTKPGTMAVAVAPTRGVPVDDAHQAGAPYDAYPAGEWTPPTWEEVVRTHSARVYRLAYRLTGNVHDAEDLTQEVFVRVFRSLSNYTPGTFEGWLHRITTNLFLDMARRRQRIRFEGLADDAAERLKGREPTPAQAYDDTHLEPDIQAALDALAPEFRAAVVLCDIEGLSY